MFFDDPKNAISVARTHQRELLQKEQMDRLARQVDSSERRVPDRFVAAFRLFALLQTKTREVLGRRARRSDFSPLHHP